ncbi:MAG: amino acid aminotransferase [Chlamydiota bacterium]
MVFFEKVPLAAPDPIFGLNNAFKKDDRASKINLSIGVYKTEDLLTPIFPVVKLAEAKIFEEEKSKEYLPIEGDAQFIECLGELVFGASLWKEHRARVASCQSLGGTGALRIGGTFLKEEAAAQLFIPHPTWPNHPAVFSACGLQVEEYPYYDMRAHQLDFTKMESFLQTLPTHSIVVLHASSHNPTGCDPSPQQWRELCTLFRKKNLIPFFDFAYQGFGNGIEEDPMALRMFMQEGLEMLVATSCSKNFSLYAERVGCLFIVTASKKAAEHVLSRVKQMVRHNYSNPPMHGAKIVSCILSSPTLRKAWESEVAVARSRIAGMREQLCKMLVSQSQGMDFTHIQNTVGMFVFSGLSKPHVERLIAEFGIYMTYDGRLNVCGLTQRNIERVVSAMIEVSR